LTTPAELRRRISFGSVGLSGERLELSRKEIVALLLLDDAALLTMHEHLAGPEARGKSCAELAAELQGVCGYAHIKAMLRMLHLLVRVHRGNGQSIRDRSGRFVAEYDMGDATPDRQALIRRWVATGVPPATAKKWAEEMGASEGLT
jgi:hypothetical protein